MPSFSLPIQKSKKEVTKEKLVLKNPQSKSADITYLLLFVRKKTKLVEEMMLDVMARESSERRKKQGRRTEQGPQTERRAKVRRSFGSGNQTPLLGTVLLPRLRGMVICPGKAGLRP